MGLLIVLALLVVLDVAAWFWGHDSRDGHDWGESMTEASVRRTFEVEAPLEEAWHAEVERWPEWAPHIVSVSVSPQASSVRHRAASSGSSGWVGTPSACRHGSHRCVGSGSAGFPGVRIYYDHRFEASGPASTRLEWVVELDGPLAPLIRRVFSRVYGRNVDRAIPHLQEWFRQQAKID